MTSRQEVVAQLAAPIDQTSPAMFVIVPALTALAFLAARKDPFRLAMNLAPFFVPFPWSLPFSAGAVLQAAARWDLERRAAVERTVTGATINPLAGLE